MADDSIRPDEQPSRTAEWLNAAIDRLLAERSPREAPATAEEAELLRTAVLLKQLRAEEAQPRAAFVAALERRLRQARERPRRLVSRRRALATAAAAAAAGVAGFAVGRLADEVLEAPASERPRELVIPQGEWFPVARLDEVPPGTVLPFTAGAVLGHLLNQGGTLVALSAVCTHMGCLLRWQAHTRQFLCPCHGATFGPDGVIQPTPEYPYRPPPLPHLAVKVENGLVYVWSAAPDAQPLQPRAPDRPAPGPPAGTAAW
jgi:nitrite reductase/ring-hydroxylating ferredoxin subunit